MKPGIHPEYHTKATVTCACGESFTIGSSVQAISVELCSKCHPFYTGKQKIVDTARRVDRFQQRVAKKSTVAATRTSKRTKRARDTERRKTKSETIKEEM